MYLQKIYCKIKVDKSILADLLSLLATSHIKFYIFLAPKEEKCCKKMNMEKSLLKCTQTDLYENVCLWIHWYFARILHSLYEMTSNCFLLLMLYHCTVQYPLVYNIVGYFKKKSENIIICFLDCVHTLTGQWT